MANKIILIGSGGHSSVAIDIIRKQKKKIIGYLDVKKNLKLKIKYLGNILENLTILRNKNILGFIAIGNNYTRQKVYKTIFKINPQFKWVKLVDPSCIISKTTLIGEGSIVVAGSIINSATVIGKHCIINTRNTIDHDNFIDDFSSTGPSVSTGGSVSIGKNSHIGISSTVKNNIKIGSNTIVGSFSYVNKNCLSNGLYIGVPAKKKKKWKFGANYL